MKSAKDNITKLVEAYIKFNPDEWVAFKDMMTLVRASVKDEEFGTANKDSSSEYRALYEMPETLQMMFIKGLTEEEMTWLKAGIPTSPNQGGRWFATKFKDFRIPNKV